MKELQFNQVHVDTFESFLVAFFRHGDMLFLLTSTTHTGERPGSSDSVSMDTSGPVSVVEDEVDQILYKEDGKIYRKKDEQLLV